MKAPLLLKDRYLLSALVVSAVVAVLIHFPEVLSLSDVLEREELFAGMEPEDVFNEILFTFISLLLLFWINSRIFRFNTPLVRITRKKMLLSFLLTWAASNLFGQLFVLLHHRFDIPAIDAMVHHYLHPLRDLIIACIVTGSNYIFHLIAKQQRIVVENEELRTESLRHQYESLKNQLNPHMLFISLNTLQSLIRESPPKAPRLYAGARRCCATHSGQRPAERNPGRGDAVCRSLHLPDEDALRGEPPVPHRCRQTHDGHAAAAHAWCSCSSKMPSSTTRSATATR